MRTFKSISEALNSIFPKKSDFAELGNTLIKHYQKRIADNNVTGNELAESTVARKISRGAKNPEVKLLEGGGMMRQIKKIVSNSRLEVGLMNEQHIKFKPKDPAIQVNDLARIHHFSKSNPRTFLTLSDEEYQIVGEWLRNVLRRNCG